MTRKGGISVPPINKRLVSLYPLSPLIEFKMGFPSSFLRTPSTHPNTRIIVSQVIHLTPASSCPRHCFTHTHSHLSSLKL